MKLRILIITLLLFFACSANEEANIQSEQEIYEYSPQASLDLYVSANRFLDQRNYKEAEKTFKKLLILDPKFSKAWEGYADSMLLQNDLESAINLLDQAISLNPLISSHYSKKSLVLYYLEDFEDAEKYTLKALELEKSDARALIVLGSIKTQNGFFEESEDIFQRALNLEPDDSSIYFWRAKAYIIMSNFESAMSDFNKSIELDRSQPAYYIERALLYKFFGDIDKAILDLKEAIEVAKNPRNQQLINKASSILEDIENQ
tara:strand:- start:1458 stop:2240 length:783 start_codon:yes stop_codon:yes gene_type:complete